MTLHLYYEDSHLTEFSAHVLEATTVEGKPAAVLDRTAFYPTSGGQPCDTGSLSGVRVLGVEEDAAGRILHILEAPLPPGPVQGTVDWERRFDHMQQHTGQHVLSQAFLCTARAATLSFHLGQETSTIDIDLAQADAAILSQTEDLAARIIFEDRPVHVLGVTKEEQSSLGVRKESQREGEIRVIDIEGFDRSPCGGTHVRRCGEIGSIFILGSDRYKGGIRVEFVCGGRALKAFRKDHESLKELARLMSAHPHEIPKLVEKLLQERAGLLRDKKHLEEQLLDLEARELLHRASRCEGLILVCGSYQDRKIESLKILAQKVAAAPGAAAILVAIQDTAQVVVARHPDLRGDCGAIVRQLTGRLGGRGGGKPELAQAGGIPLAAADAWSQAVADYFLSPDQKL
jgi:alanyl-tRNA synthetase